MTLFAWFGPWAWPGWPAFTAIDLFFGHTGFSEYPFAMKSVIFTLLLIINISFWGAIAYVAMRLLARRTKKAG
jgi:hypothetical protein